MATKKFQLVLKSEKDKTREALIYLMFTWGKRFKISLGVKVLPLWWDKELQEATISSKQKQQEQRQLKKLNRFLKEVKNITESCFSECRYFSDVMGTRVRNDIKYNLNNLVNKEKKEEENKNISVLDYFQKQIDEMPNKFIKRTGK